MPKEHARISPTGKLVCGVREGDLAVTPGLSKVRAPFTLELLGPPCPSSSCIFPLGTSLWSQGDSSPQACDPYFLITFWASKILISCSEAPNSFTGLCKVSSSKGRPCTPEGLRRARLVLFVGQELGWYE